MLLLSLSGCSRPVPVDPVYLANLPGRVRFAIDTTESGGADHPSTDYHARVPDAAPAAPSDASLAEVMATRAMRRARPDPVPDELIDELIQAAMWAPTGSYQQGEVFVVVTDRARIARLAQLWRD